jgi:DNA-binding response OmpR family regulator
MAHRCQHVLVIDPEPWSHVDLTRALRSQNLAVLSASNSDAALQALGKGLKPDAVLVDFDARDPDTARLLRFVKSHAASIIALVPDVPLSRIGPMADRYLLKPLHVEGLIAALNELFASRLSPADQSR